MSRQFFAMPMPRASTADYLHIFDYHGRRVTRRDLDWDDWRNWQAELNARLRAAIAFLYGNFVRGVRRVVIDGIEPADRPGESIQFNLFEYVYHQILRKDPEWVARDLFREAYRRHAEEAARHTYDPADIGCLLLYTSHETMLDDLISRPLDEGDVLSQRQHADLHGQDPRRQPHRPRPLHRQAPRQRVRRADRGVSDWRGRATN